MANSWHGKAKNNVHGMKHVLWSYTCWAVTTVPIEKVSCGWCPLMVKCSECSLRQSCSSLHNLTCPLNIQPVVVMRGLKRQQAAASTNFVGCFLLVLFSLFFSLFLLSVLNDLTGPSAGSLAQITYSIPFHNLTRCEVHEEQRRIYTRILPFPMHKIM